MRKSVAYLLALIMLLPGCEEKSEKHIQTDYTETISALLENWTEDSGEHRALQRELARWYNVNLYSETAEMNFQDAYDSILYYENGVMGYIELPSRGQCIPIFHGVGKGGFVHDPQSAFPIGGRGDHSVLRMDGEVSLAEEERVILWVLGESMIYTVGLQGENSVTLICEESVYSCGRMVKD